MLRQNGGNAQSQVARLEPKPAQASAQRIAAVRSWHIDQATESENRPVAVLSFYVTESGHIRTREVGIEPEHAKLLMVAIRRATQKLEIEADDVIRTEMGIEVARRRRATDQAQGTRRTHLVGL